MNGYPPEVMDLDAPVTNGIKNAVNEWPDAPLDRNEFYRDLQAMHYARNTVLDPNPRVHGKPIDLYDLFYNIEGRGGYDKVSAEKLLWRKIAAEFHLAGQHSAASAFQIKTVYYKNLAAYAIKRVHKQEPPPKEILEDLTAKGSDLLTRTVHNFRTPRKFDAFQNGTPQRGDDDGSDSDTRGTPQADDSARATLRQAPPQRVFPQPDMSATRQRQQMPHVVQPLQPSQTPGGYSTTNSGLNANGTAFQAGKYETRTFPLSFRPVPTPGHHPVEFQEKARRIRSSQLEEVGRLPPSKPQFMAPGTGFAGPNIYLRVLTALRSQVPEEQRYALTHLVKISHERGDKFRFDDFTGFAEGLIEKALEIAALFYHVNWEISYTKGEELARSNVLDGIDGTSDILEKISNLQELNDDDGLETETFARELQLCMETVLVLRNMALLPYNAQYLAEEQIVIKDLLVILLNLPNRDSLVEMKNDALDIAGELTEYWSLESDDPLYKTLPKYVAQKDDRGAAVSALRAICKFSLRQPETNKLPGIPIEIIDTLIQWCTLEDEELVAVCLDFFYQYTAVPENVAILLRATKQGQIDLKAFTHQLARLPFHGSQDYHEFREIAPAIALPQAKEIPIAPQELMEQLVNVPEPERATAWLKACFEEDPTSEMTQISLWQAYQSRFQNFGTEGNRRMLAAADFIKRINETFKNTSAQVLQTVTPPKFIIKGIRPRAQPVDIKGRPFIPCLWINPQTNSACGNWCSTPEKLYEHIMQSHLSFTRDDSGTWDLDRAQLLVHSTETNFHCRWAGCKHTTSRDMPVRFGIHVKTHLPDTGPDVEYKAKHNYSRRGKVDFNPASKLVEAHVAKPEKAVYEQFTWKNTTAREYHNGQQEAEGIPPIAILVLRNIARSLPKAVKEPRSDEIIKYWYKELLQPLMNQLWHIAANNLMLTRHIYDLLETLEKEYGDSQIVAKP